MGPAAQPGYMMRSFGLLDPHFHPPALNSYGRSYSTLPEFRSIEDKDGLPLLAAPRCLVTPWPAAQSSNCREAPMLPAQRWWPGWGREQGQRQGQGALVMQPKGSRQARHSQGLWEDQACFVKIKAAEDSSPYSNKCLLDSTDLRDLSKLLNGSPAPLPGSKRQPAPNRHLQGTHAPGNLGVRRKLCFLQQ